MKKPGPATAGLAATFLLGCALFNYPLVSVFNVQATVLGIPVLHAYLFAAWALVIGLVALVCERGD